MNLNPTTWLEGTNRWEVRLNILGSKGRHDHPENNTQHNDIQQNSTHKNGTKKDGTQQNII